MLREIWLDRRREVINAIDLPDGPEKDTRKRDLASRRAAESRTLLSNYKLNSGEMDFSTVAEC
jgi:hypothetical protein